MTAIEELEKLANFYDEDTEGPIYFRALSDRIRDILLRLRTEDRDGKRAAFVAGAEWGEGYAEEAERRWPS